MTIKWNLKKFIEKKHSISSATDFKKLIQKNTGFNISLQNICNYLNKNPSMIRLDTMEIFCSALDCNLQDILKISPSKKPNKSSKKLSYKNTPNTKKGLSDFPNPEDYD
ncbi:MAG: helix-turn-helix transcriptional regulator [Candidatus Staskawiczbacteria bacterium]|jgi:DNA-binding Xre family transcriptional regulator